MNLEITGNGFCIMIYATKKSKILLPLQYYYWMFVSLY